MVPTVAGGCDHFGIYKSLNKFVRKIEKRRGFDTLIIGGGSVVILMRANNFGFVTWINSRIGKLVQVKKFTRGGANRCF